MLNGVTVGLPGAGDRGDPGPLVFAAIVDARAVQGLGEERRLSVGKTRVYATPNALIAPPDLVVLIVEPRRP